MRLVWRRGAELQLKLQLQYLKEVSPLGAKRMRTRIKQRPARLNRAPLTGRLARQPGIRELVIAGTPYVAVYEVAADTITILQFFHGSQDRAD